MNYAKGDDATTAKDEKVEAFGVKVFVDPKAIFFLVGTEMDYEETELAAEFKFNNPNSKGQCGCGESFNV
jgi:iron-sulfur cluster assembly protein